jgi:hypothetical protein
MNVEKTARGRVLSNIKQRLTLAPLDGEPTLDIMTTSCACDAAIGDCIDVSLRLPSTNTPEGAPWVLLDWSKSEN